MELDDVEALECLMCGEVSIDFSLICIHELELHFAICADCIDEMEAA